MRHEAREYDACAWHRVNHQIACMLRRGGKWAASGSVGRDLIGGHDVRLVVLGERERRAREEGESTREPLANLLLLRAMLLLLSSVVAAAAIVHKESSTVARSRMRVKHVPGSGILQHVEPSLSCARFDAWTTGKRGLGLRGCSHGLINE